MRRNQIDAGSQPVRNIFTHSTVELTNGTTVVHTNRTPGLAAWTLSGDASYADGEITLNAPGAYAESPLIAVETVGDAFGEFQLDYKASAASDGTTKYLYSVSYYDAAQTPILNSAGYTSNGRAADVDPEVWNLRGGKATWGRIFLGPGVAYVRFRVTVNVTYQNPPVKIKRPTFTSGPHDVTNVGRFEYFDGNTPADDFTYSWTGAVHASTSIKRGTVPTGYTTLYYAALTSSTDWSASGSRSFRITPNTTKFESFFGIGGNWGGPGPFKSQTTYTVLATLRLTAPLTGSLDARALSIVWRENSARIAQVSAQNVAGVQNVRLTFRTGNVSYGWLEFFNGASQGNGDVWWDNIMVVEGNYTGDFINPVTNPLAKWDGTPNASTSVGYPPGLLQIAGTPMVHTTTEGNTIHPITGDPLDGFTVYLAYEPANPYADWTGILAVGAIGAGNPNYSLGALHYQRNGTTAPYNLTHIRVGTTAHINQSGILGTVPGWTSGRVQVVSMAVTDGITELRTSLNGGADSTRTLQPGDGIAKQGLKLRVGSGSTEGAANGAARAIVALYYPGYHDVATRQAISRYLGNKYGANVA